MGKDTAESKISELIVSSKAPGGDVAARISELMLDTSGILIAAARTDFASLMAKAVHQSGDTPLLTGGSSDLMGALLINSSLGYCLDLDAVYNPATLHIAAALFPSLLTLAAYRGSEGQEFMRAFNAGHDVAAAFGRAFSPSEMYARNFHPSSVCGAIGCAAASSVLLGLDEAHVSDALGLATTMASGLTTVFDEERHHSAPFQIGHAARCGVEAALFAEAGVAGPPMFGKKSIMDTFSSGQSDGKTALLFETLEKGGSVMQTGFKRHAACKFLQTAVDAAIAMREEGFDAKDISEIRLSVAPSTAPLIDNAGDLTHNAQLVLSAALIDGCVSGGQHASIRSRGDIAALSRKVTVVADGKLERYYPQAMPAGLELKNRRGKILSKFVEYAKGDPKNALSTSELMEKFDNLTSGRPDSGNMAKAIERIHQADGPSQMLEMLCRRGGV